MRNFIFYSIFLLMVFFTKLDAMEAKKRKESEKEHKELEQPQIKKRKIIPKDTRVKSLQETSLQKFIDAAPEIENLSELLESIPAEEIRQQIKAEFQKRLPFEETRLHNATSEQEVENFLRLGIDPNLQDRSGKTALNALIDKGHLNAAFHLVAIGLAAFPYQTTTLDKIEKDASIDPLIKAFLEATQGKNLDVISPDEFDVTPLQKAIQHEDLDLALEIIEMLKKQQEVDTINDSNLADMTVLKLAVFYLPELIPTLKKLDINFEIDDEEYGNPLLFVAIKNNTDAIKPLIDAGIDVNKTNRSGLSALMGLAHDNNLSLMTLLLENGANVNAKDNKGHTPLMIAKSHPEAIRLLLDAGADSNMQDEQGNTALMHALSENIESAELLINAGADLNLENKNNRTALFMAAIYNPNALELLIKAGADPNKPNSKGELPIADAINEDAIEGVKKLIELGATSNEKSSVPDSRELYTPLEIAVENDNFALVKILLDAGARVTQKAIEDAHNNIEIKKILLEYFKK